MFFTKNIINNYLNIEHIEHEEWDSKSNDINIEKGSKHILNGGLTCVLFAWKRKAPKWGLYHRQLCDKSLFTQI